MGLENRESGNYITIYNGKLSTRVAEGTPGAMQRVNKLGKTVFEKFYDSFTGKLVGIKTQDSPYGKNWMFSFKDKAEVYHLQLPYSNSYAKAFLKMLPNINLAEEMQVSPSVKEVDGKSKSSLFVKQAGEWVKQAYTKEVPNGLPQMKQVMIKGQQVWDDSEQLAFLEKMVQDQVLPKLPKVDLAVAEGNKTSSPQESVDALSNELNGGAGADLDF